MTLCRLGPKMRQVARFGAYSCQLGLKKRQDEHLARFQKRPLGVFKKITIFAGRNAGKEFHGFSGSGFRAFQGY